MTVKQELQPWFDEWQDRYQGSNLLYLQAAETQIRFVQDRLSYIPAAFDIPRSPVYVIGTHHSKSVELPVYQFDLKPGLTVVARNNFHNWNLSIRSEIPVTGLSFHGFGDADRDTSYLFFEGMTDRFPTYAESDGRRFSLSLPISDLAFSFMMCLVRHVEKWRDS